MEIQLKEFLGLLKSKSRRLAYTIHSEGQSQKRHLPLSVFEKDLKGSSPVAIKEQESESTGERKFDLYYLQSGDYFHRYVIVINSEIRLITLMRVSREIQKKWAKK